MSAESTISMLSAANSRSEAVSITRTSPFSIVSCSIDTSSGESASKSSPPSMRPFSSITSVSSGSDRRMSKMKYSPRKNGASSRSMANASTRRWDSSSLPIVTSSNAIDGNGRKRAEASPATVTSRPSTRDASASKRSRYCDQSTKPGPTNAAMTSASSSPPTMT